MFNIMSRQDRHTPQLNLGGGGPGGRGTEYLLIAALAVVIIGSLVLTFYYSGSGPRGSKDRPDMMFQCAECDEVFKVDPKDMPRMDREAMMEMSAFHPDCPKCNAEEAGLPMVRCPNEDCKKYYVSPRLEWDEMSVRGGRPPAGEGPLDICPHCDTDRLKWYRKNMKKRR